jgi:hypothetical protein
MCSRIRWIQVEVRKACAPRLRTPVGIAGGKYYVIAQGLPLMGLILHGRTLISNRFPRRTASLSGADFSASGVKILLIAGVFKQLLTKG